MVNLLNKISVHNTRFFQILVFTDVVIVLLHLFLGRQFSFFHLDIEKNLPTTYQALKLIILGTFFLVMVTKFKVAKAIWSFIYPLAIVLIFLGLDEHLQIHENIYRIFELLPWLHPSKIISLSMNLGYRSSLWILYYLPFIFIFILWSGYWLRVFQTTLKSNFWIICLSTSLLFVVLVAKILSSTGAYAENSYFWLVTFEEMAEMLFASTLVLVGLKSINRSRSKTAL